MASYLLDLSRQQPPEAPAWPMKCGDCGTPKPSVKPLFFTVEPEAIQAYEKAVAPAMGWRVDEISRKMPITTTDKIPAVEKESDAATDRQIHKRIRAGVQQRSGQSEVPEDQAV